MADLDDKDKALLALLQEDGRLSNVKLAEELHLSETPCWRRVKRLEESGIIEGYHAKLNRRELGIGLCAFVQLNCKNHSSDFNEELEETVASTPEILSCHRVTGDVDYFLEIVTKDLESFEDFLDSVLRKLPNVISIKSSLSLRELKSEGPLPLEGI